MVNRALASTGPWLVAIVAVLISSALAGVLIVTAPPGIPVSSTAVQVALPIARVVADLAGVLVVGCLLAAVLLPLLNGGGLGAESRSLIVTGSRAALVWLTAIAVSAILTLSDAFGLPVGAALSQTAAISFLTQSVVGHAFLAQMICAAVIAGLGPIASRRWQAIVLLGVALVGMASRSTSGHSGVGSDHESVTLVLAVHIGAVSLWVGGLAALGLLLLRRVPIGFEIASRYSALALWCVTAVAVTGFAQVGMRLSDPIDLFTTAYGLLLVAKAILLALLIAIGWLQRRSSLPALRRGARGPFAAMVAVELALMAIVMGISVTLSRTPTVSRGQGTGAEAHVHPLPDPPAGLAELMGQWRVDGAMLILGILLVAAYAHWRSRSIDAGYTWGGGPVLTFSAGLIVLLIASCSGLGTFSRFMAGALLVHSVLLLLIVPTLLILGIPPAVAQQVGWARRVDPAIPIVATVTFVVAVFGTPAIGYLLWPFWGRTFLDLALVGLGLWSCGAVFLAARGPGRWRLAPALALAAALIAVIVVALAVPGIISPQYFAFFVPPYATNLANDETMGLLASLGLVVAWLVGVVLVAGRSRPVPVPIRDTVSVVGIR